MLEFELTTPMICNFFFAISRIAGGKLCCLEKNRFVFFNICWNFLSYDNEWLAQSKQQSQPNNIFFSVVRLKCAVTFCTLISEKYRSALKPRAWKKCYPCTLLLYFHQFKYRNSFHRFFWLKPILIQFNQIWSRFGMLDINLHK